MHSRCSCATGCPYACSCTFAWSSHSAISLRESNISQSLSRISAPICLSDTGRQVRLSYILTHTTWTCSHIMLCVVHTLDLLDWVFSSPRFHTRRRINYELGLTPVIVPVIDVSNYSSCCQLIICLFSDNRHSIILNCLTQTLLPFFFFFRYFTYWKKCVIKE